MNISNNLDWDERLRSLADEVLADAGAPGAAVALMVDGRMAAQVAAGFRDLERRVPLAQDARFYIYSNTKTLIAALVLRLAEAGRLALEAPFQKYLPEIALETPVSVRRLLNHSGGIPDYGGLPAYYAAVRAHPGRPWSDAEFLAATLGQGLAYPPGAGWGYSNIGYLLLRRLAERISTQPLADALREALFAPLGLDGCFVARGLEDAALLTPASSAFFTRGALEDVRQVYHPGWVSHGVVAATAPELARLLDGILGGALLSSGSRAAMLDALDVPVQHPLFRQPGYGLGLMVDRQSRFGLLAGHGGGGPGYSAGAFCLPHAGGHRVTAAALVNSDAGDAGQLLAHRALMLAAEMLASA